MSKMTVFKDADGFRMEFDEEIPEEERRFYLKVYPTVDLVSERKVHCTVCNVHIGTAPAQESNIRMHPILKVTHCKKCHEFYNSGEFSKGEDGSELYCRWCGQGGEVYCCSKCPYVFCTNCIVQNLSKDCVNDIEENENWNCFVCAPKIMWHLRAQHWALMNYIEKQKQAIVNKNLSESTVRKRMRKDMNTCCKKPKSGNMSDSSCDSEISLSRKRKSSTPSSLDKKIVPKLTIKPPEDEEQSEPKKIKPNDVVVCTPDVLSMISENNANKPVELPGGISEQERQRQQQQQRQIQVQQQHQQHQQSSPANTPVPPLLQVQQHHQTLLNSAAASNQAPPLIIRNLHPQFRGVSPTIVTRKTVVGPRPPTATPGQSPVYHTINGFRIDLNTAAQQETFRLPNGKLIQVKRQGTTAGTVNSTPPSGMLTQNANPTPVTLNNQLIRSQLNQLQNRGIQANTHTILNQSAQSQGPVQQFTLQQPQLATIRYAPGTAQALPTNTTITATVANNQGNVLNHVMNGAGGTIATVAIRPALQQPTLAKQIFASTPLGQARNQLQSQIFTSMDICQHLTGKIHTLTNSNAYKMARNYTDVKELYIHLSYLFTYAIGRFKTLQEKCMDDMRCLGFAGDAASLESGQLEKYASDNDDDDIVIVEPKTTLIDLDSDNDDEQLIPAKKLPILAAVKPLVLTKLPLVPTKQPLVPTKLNALLSNKQPTIIKPAGTITPPVNIPAIIRPVEVAAVQEEAAESGKHPPIDSMDCDMDITANFLAGMLDVELYEGTETVQINAPPKKPRKKTTNKPNPHLIKQQQIQAREKERERIKRDIKLNVPCKISLERIDDRNDVAKKLLGEYMTNHHLYSKESSEFSDSNGSMSPGCSNAEKEIDKESKNNANQNDDSQEIVTVVETIENYAECNKSKKNEVVPSILGESTSQSDDEKKNTTTEKIDSEPVDILSDSPPSSKEKSIETDINSPNAETSEELETVKDSAVLTESDRDDVNDIQKTSDDTQDTISTNDDTNDTDENNDKLEQLTAMRQDTTANNNDAESEQIELLEVFDDPHDNDLLESCLEAERNNSSLEDNNKMEVDDILEEDNAEADSTTNNDTLQFTEKKDNSRSFQNLQNPDNECSNNSTKSTATTE